MCLHVKAMKVLQTSFGDPEHGWISISITDKVKKVVFEVDSKYESFLALITSLTKLIDEGGEFTVIWLEEPVVTTWTFTKQKDEIVFDFSRSSENQSVFQFTGSYEAVCLPFLSALQSLRSRFTEHELELKLQDSFPSPELDSVIVRISNLQNETAN